MQLQIETFSMFHTFCLGQLVLIARDEVKCIALAATFLESAFLVRKIFQFCKLRAKFAGASRVPSLHVL